MDALSREIRDFIESQTLMSDCETRGQKFVASLNANLDAERNTELAALSQRFSQQHVWQHHLRWVGVVLVWWVMLQLWSSLKRVCDCVAAFLGLLFFGPIICVAGLALSCSGAVFQSTLRVGRWGEPFQEYGFVTPGTRCGQFVHKLGLQHLPSLLNILQGEMSFIGPRLVSPGELSPHERLVRRPPRTSLSLVAPAASQYRLWVRERVRPSDWRALYLSTKAGVVTESYVTFGHNQTPDERYSAEEFSAVSAGMRHDTKLLLSYVKRIFSAWTSASTWRSELWPVVVQEEGR